MDPQELFPVEIWINIFKFLSPSDLCTACLVSTGFNGILQDPSLWANTPLNRQKIRSAGFLPIFATKFRKFKTLKLFEDCRSDDYIKVLEKVIEAKSLKELDLSMADLRSVPAEILAKTTAMVEKIVIIEEDSANSCKISIDQLTKIFQEIPNKDAIKEKHIQLKNVTNISKVPSHILDKYLSLTKSIILKGNLNLTSDQWNHILADISTNPRHLIQDLDIRTVSGLNEASPDIVAELLCTIRRVKADLSDGQWSSLFSNIAYGGPVTLEDLFLCGASVQAVHPTILGKALARMRKLQVCSNLTSAQWTQFFEEASMSGLVEDLSISGRYTGLQHVPPKVMAEALASCRRISLLNVFMTEEQWEELMKAIFTSQSNTPKLDHIHIRDADFQHLNLSVGSQGNEVVDVLEKMLARVRNVVLQNVEMSTEQWTNFFQQIMSVNPVLVKNLNLKGANLEKVPVDVVAKSLSKVEKIQLNCVNMSLDQWNNMFKEILKSPTRVKSLDLRGSNYTGVPIEILTKVQKSVPEVFINKTLAFQEGIDWPLGWWQGKILDFCSNHLPFVPRIM